MNKEELLELMQSGNIELSPSQKSVSFPIIERIYRKMINGVNIRNGISISEEFVIIDDHHRYLASLLAKADLATHTSILPLAKEMVDWRSVNVEDADWDSEADIHKHNETDARCNDMTTEQLMQLIT